MGLSFSRGWNESTDRLKGYFETGWGTPESWSTVILQGPHIHVGVPFYKSPNPTMLHNQDWSPVDLEFLGADLVPTTSFEPQGDAASYDAAYTHWGADKTIPARDRYRVVWRTMAANTGERTLIPAIMPPNAAHVDGLFSAGFVDTDARRLAVVQAFAASLLGDFVTRAVPKSTIRQRSFERLAIADMSHPLIPDVVLRALRLNCLTRAYAEMWTEAVTGSEIDDAWVGGIDYPGRPPLGDVTSAWTPAIPLRRASDRRQALVELDCLAAITLELTVDQLATIYRTQFPVLYGYDRNTYLYDANGRLVPNSVLTTWRKKGKDKLDEADRTATNASGNTYVYELPFVTLNREAEMRTAYAEFERRLKERTSG